MNGDRVFPGKRPDLNPAVIRIVPHESKLQPVSGIRISRHPEPEIYGRRSVVPTGTTERLDLRKQDVRSAGFRSHVPI